MKENIYLEEILFLIDKNYSEKKINKEDLNKIELFISALKSNNRNIKRNFKKEIFENYVYYNLLSRDEIIEKEIYKSNLQNLRKFLDVQIFEKKFTYSITAFTDFINKMKDIRVHFIETDKLELVFEIDSVYYIYSNSKLNNIKYDDLKPYLNKFDSNGLGNILDLKLRELSGPNSDTIKNTRNILIDYATNFKEIIGYLKNNEIKDLVLECGIVTKGMKYENRFTLMMYFIKNDKEILKNKDKKEYYFDTFQLCPPGC